MVIIKVLKPDLRNDQGKAQVTSREGQHKFTRVNVWIKVVIIIIWKPDSGVNPRQGLDHRSRGSTWRPKIFLRNNQSNLILTKNIFQKCQQVFWGSYTWTSSSLWSTHQINLYFITKVIIILLISTLNIN
jgi:hypothetical protein